MSVWKTYRYLKNDYQFFDTLKTKDHKIRGNCNLLIKVKFHELEWSSPSISSISCCCHDMVVNIYVLINILSGNSNY